MRYYLERLPLDERTRILDGLSAWIQDPEHAGLGKLQGRPEWSVRVAGKRILVIPDTVRKAFGHVPRQRREKVTGENAYSTFCATREMACTSLR